MCQLYYFFSSILSPKRYPQLCCHSPGMQPCRQTLRQQVAKAPPSSNRSCWRPFATWIEREHSVHANVPPWHCRVAKLSLTNLSRSYLLLLLLIIQQILTFIHGTQQTKIQREKWGCTNLLDLLFLSHKRSYTRIKQFYPFTQIQQRQLIDSSHKGSHVLGMQSLSSSVCYYLMARCQSTVRNESNSLSLLGLCIKAQRLINLLRHCVKDASDTIWGMENWQVGTGILIFPFMHTSWWIKPHRGTACNKCNNKKFSQLYLFVSNIYSTMSRKMRKIQSSLSQQRVSIFRN